MKQQKSIYSRQNDKTATTLLKASYRCLKNERIAKYVMIFLSFGICLAAIFNRFLPQMLPRVENIYDVQADAATYINLISGVILVAGIAIGFYTSRMHTEGTVLQDRYDAYVFDNPPNLAVLRPIAQTVINVYAQKVHKRDEAFRDCLFKPGDDPDPDTAQFNYINDEAHSNYKLYISIQPFFLTLWIGFCLMIIVIAVSFNVRFIETLINIMIPSLSAISTICNSWYNYRLQVRQLQNLLAVIDQIQRLPDDQRYAYIRDKRNMRALADGLYNYRVSPFVIPNFLIRRHLRSVASQSTSITISRRVPRTEMPSLLLPDLDSTVPEINDMINARPEIKTVTFSPTHTITELRRANRRYTARAAAARRREAAKNATSRTAKAAAKAPTPPAKPATTARQASANKPAAAKPAAPKPAAKPSDAGKEKKK